MNREQPVGEQHTVLIQPGHWAIMPPRCAMTINIKNTGFTITVFYCGAAE